MRNEAAAAANDYHDGALLPMEAVAVCPVSIDDLAELVAQVPRDMAGELARMAAWRAVGFNGVPPTQFEA